MVFPGHDLGRDRGPDAPALALAPSGGGVIAWLEMVPEGQKHSYVTVLQAATRSSASAAWEQPVTISRPGVQVSSFAVKIDSAGEAVVVWNPGYATRPPIDVATGNTATGRWGEPRQLAAAGHGGFDPLLSTESKDGVRWSPPAIVPGSTDAFLVWLAVARGGYPQAALDRAGTATLVWNRLLSQPKFSAIIDTTTYPVG